MAKTLTNIETIKAMVNANELETLRLATWGVQAYNVFDGQEYTNIITVEKRGGRYYFVDVVGNSIIISRYHDAERVCGEFIEHYNEELAVVRQYIDVMKKYGRVTIKTALWSKFVDECNVQGVTAEYVEGSIQMVHTAAEAYVIETHRLVNGGEDEPKADTANESTANECTATTSEEAPQAHNEPKADNYTANALRTACRLANACALWLRSSHTFADDEDPAERVTLTGWQYIGVAFAVTLFALVLSIDWDRTLASL